MRIRHNASPRQEMTRRILITIVSLTSLLVAGSFMAACGGTSSTTTAANTPGTTAAGGGGGATTQVVLQNSQISPTSVTVNVGDTVTWTSKDSFAHHLVGDKGEFDSGDMAAGATFSFTFKTAGTIAYHCSIHPSMTGTVVVGTSTETTAAGAGSTAPSGGSGY